MLYLEWSRHEKQLKVIDDICVWFMPVSCTVRNELNKWRPNPHKEPAAEVVYSVTKDNILTDIPVMPRQFPIGKWNITSVEPRTDKYRKPYIILTDAFQELDEWALNVAGGYNNPTGKKVLDYQYGLHYSSSNTTQGCIKIYDSCDLMRLIQSIKREFDSGFQPVLEVVG